MTSLRVGFVGCGLIARSHARNLIDQPAEIVAVHDLDSERAERFRADHGTPATVIASHLDDVVALSDAVYVCTWTSAHPEPVLAAAAAGRAVFCEKPLGIDLPTATALTEAVTGAGIVNQAGLVLRASPAFRWLRHQVADPAAGPIMNVVFRDDQYLPNQGMYESSWRADPARAGSGTLLEHSIHDLDLLRWILGPIRQVSAVTGEINGLVGIEDQATVTLVAESGAQASLVSVWHQVLTRPSQRRVEILCRNAVLELTGDWAGPVSMEHSGGHGPALEGPALTRAAARLDGRTTNPDADFVAAALAGRPASPDFAEALAAHVLADAAYRSAADGGRPVVVSESG